MTQDTITLSASDMSRCRDYAVEAVRQYGQQENGVHLASHGAESNVEGWTVWKAGELAMERFSQHHDRLDAGVDWVNKPDSGHDLVAFGLKWDVKTIPAHYHYLCWPLKKRHLYFRKNFTALVLVKERAPVFTISRWMARDSFFIEKQTADGVDPKGLDKDTWYVKDSDAWTMEKLFDWLEAKKSA